MRVPAGVIVVKLGGSLAFSPHLRPWLDVLASRAGTVVLVAGGGPFAEVIRDAQKKMGFADDAAHHMALTAMEQFGRALASMQPALLPAATSVEIVRALKQKRVPVWSPARLVLAAKDIPASWDATSDSLAAWLAGHLGAQRVLLVKHGAFPTDPVRVDDLVARGIVDPLFPKFLAASRAMVSVVGAADHAFAATAMPRGLLPGAPIDLP